MVIQLLLLAFKIPQSITLTLLSLLLASLSYLGLYKSPPDPDDFTSSSATHILILDGSSPSLLPIPLHVITSAIKTQVPIIRYSRSDNPVCTVCLDCIDGCDLIRELVTCNHVFHLECLDKWVDVGQVNCPLCRSMLLPPKKLLSAAAVSARVAQTVAADVSRVL